MTLPSAPSHQSIVVMIKQLEAARSRQAVADAIPALVTAIDTNEPKLLVGEAHEVWKILHDFWQEYSGGLNDQLEWLLLKIENLFPEEVFE